MGLLDNFSEETQYSFKRTFMECSIIFTMSKDEEMNTLKGNMFLQTVLALMVGAEKPCTANEIATIYRQKTGKLIDEELFISAFRQLQSLGFITPNNGNYVVHGQLLALIKKGVDEVETLYSKLIDELIGLLEAKVPNKLDEVQLQQVRNNIKETMTLYAKLHGMESLIDDTEEYDEDDDENDDLIKSAKQGLDELTGNLLVEVLGDAIAKPTPFQAKTINLLMQSFIGAQIMQIDPLLGQFETAKLKGKTFVFDTDFVLNSITKHHSQSSSYRRLIKTLRKIGCNIVIPEEVLEEVVRHSQHVESNNNWFANAFEVLNEEVVEREATNVFVKDYYMWKFKTKKNGSIRKFMRDNFYDESRPFQFLKGVIENELRQEVFNEPLEIPKDLEKYKAELTEKIKKEIQLSFKNKWRDDEETESLAKTDATLYLYTMSENSEARRDSKNEILSATAYIITYTTKSIRCAKAMNIHQDIVTRPEILINILQRIGEFDDKGKMGLELFDNPFLTYIMRQNWQTVKRLADFGVDLHGKCITRLEYDLEEVLHDMITEEAENEEITSYEMLRSDRPEEVKQFFKIYDKLRAKNYTVIPMLQKMAEQYKMNEKALDQAVEEKERVEGMLAKKARGYATYLQKVGKSGQNHVKKSIKKKR